MSAEHISSYIPQSHIFPTLPPGERDDVLRAIVDQLAEAGAFDTERATTVYRAVLQRERVGSTGVGRGIAIPHCKTSAVEAPVVAFAKTVEPIDYGATDGAPVHSMFLVVSPAKSGDAHVAILRWIAQVARNDYYAKVLRSTTDAASLHSLFREIDGIA